MQNWTNLSHRNNAGIEVWLDWNEAYSSSPDFTEELRVTVVDHKTGTDFTFYPLRDTTLDAYLHPFAYAEAAMNGKTRVAV